MVLVLLPATQGIYGFIIGIIASGKLGMDMVTAQGWAIFGAVMPMAISGLVSGIFQGKSAVKLYLCRRETGFPFGKTYRLSRYD